MITHSPLRLIAFLSSAIALSSVSGASSFVTPISAHRSPTNERIITKHFASESGERNDVADNAHTHETSKVAIDKTRRNLLSRIAPASTLPFLLNSDVAEAESPIIAEMETNPPLSIPQKVFSATSNQRAPPRALCADSEEEARIAIFERVAPSVVYIDTFSEKSEAFSTDVTEVPIGSGSGYIWDDSGHIVTNFHVVQQAKSAQVAILTPRSNKSSVKPTYTSMRPGTLGADGSTVLKGFVRSVYKAKVVGVDPTKDIAVLKIDDVPIGELRPIEVGKSMGLRVGQGSLAIGNPYGLDHTLTTGVISGVGREVKSPTGRPISNVIQTDAAINPGNSGGPLLDSSGKMIGMATAIYSPSGASAGVGFAIPVDTVEPIVGMLIENGQIVRPLLGVSILDSKQARQALGITKGILILDVKPGTPAAQAGLRGLKRTETGIVEIGDIIIAIESTPIENEGDLFKAIENFEPGNTLKVTVNRPEIEVEGDGSPELKLKEITFEVKLIPGDDSSGVMRMKDE